MEILAVENLSFRHAGEARDALRSVSFRLERGDFALLTGGTGCGKTTLLRLIKPELAPQGERQGRVLFRGRETETLGPRESAAGIGFVFQRPEEQIVTDRVWHELAFGLENLGVPADRMRRMVAETAQFFGLEDCFDARPDQLSGGKKQLLNLAAVTAMEPELLLLDEPTARLDPIAAKRFLAAVERLNRERGMTILMAEHRLEDSLSRASRLLLMEEGRIVEDGAPREVCGRMRTDTVLEGALPAAVQLWRACGREGACPLNTGEGRSWVLERAGTEQAPFRPATDAGGTREGGERTESAQAGDGRSRKEREPALRFRDVCFRFSREGQDVLRSASFEVYPGEIFALLGGNGSGKTTLLRAAAGLIPPYSGEIRLFGERWRGGRRSEMRHEGAAMLPQDPQTLFLRGSVREELKDSGIGAEALPFDLSALMDRHPYDLSGGEQQLLGLAKVLAARPKLLLLDEPTGGLDAGWRTRIRKLLRELRAKGMTMLIVTHDAEFAAETADRCGLLFRGSVVAAAEPHAFLAGGSYYTTPVSRMVPGCVTVAEAAERLKGRMRG